MLKNVTNPSKVGLMSQNPYANFTEFETEIESMKPIMPEKTATNLARNLVAKW